jgi:dTDP-4-amino-4,6-dideoxy-D-galactose acyltransferase
LITELEWDSEFFGRKIGRLTKISPERRLKRLIEEACKAGYTYLTCRVIVEGMSKIQILEKYGFYITDVGTVWEREIDEILEPTILVKTATAKDVPMLKSMVRGLFRESRFYNDPFFTHEEAERFYQAWVENSLRNKGIKTFYVEGSGFTTCKKLSKSKGDIPLIGVVPEKQGKGIGKSLIWKALDWFKKMGVKTVTVRTQTNNIRAMNLYAGLGFRIKHVDVTMGLIMGEEEVLWR